MPSKTFSVSSHNFTLLKAPFLSELLGFIVSSQEEPEEEVVEKESEEEEEELEEEPEEEEEEEEEEFPDSEEYYFEDYDDGENDFHIGLDGDPTTDAPPPRRKNRES